MAVVKCPWKAAPTRAATPQGNSFGTDKGTNPEELIGAVNAGCFSMAFSLALEQAGYIADSIETDAAVSIDKSGDGFRITRVHLHALCKVPGIDPVQFRAIAELNLKRLASLATDSRAPA